MDNTNATVIKKRKKKKYNAKKTCIILLSLAVLFAALAVIIHFTTRVTNDSYANCAVGDVNGDGKINSGDAILILKYMVGQEDKLFENQIKNADTNLDEEVNSQDALLILRYSIGDIASIPYDEQKQGRKHLQARWPCDQAAHHSGVEHRVPQKLMPGPAGFA